MATQLAERRENPMTVIRQNLQQMAPEFKAALPAHVTVEKFTRVAQTAIQNNPDLAQADRRSLFGAITRLAAIGLLPDGREAAIVIFNTKKDGGWVKAAQAMPMVAGVLKMLRQSGEIAKVSAHVVHEHDQFDYTLGFDEDVKHVPPPLDQPRGKVIGAYATAVLKDGSRMLEVMSLEQINQVRNVSRSKDKGPWVDWFGEMARKTVLRRLSKRLPMSTDVQERIDRDRDEPAAPLEHAPQPAEVVELQPQPVSRLDAIEAQIEDEPQTGRADEDHGDQHDGADLITDDLLSQHEGN